MIEKLTAAVLTAYGIYYAGYYLSNLARHLSQVYRGAHPGSPEPTAHSPLAPSAPGDETKVEQNDCRPSAVVTPQSKYSKAKIKAELHETQSDIKAVKRKNKKDMEKTQDHWNLYQKRGNLQNQESERVATTPFKKISLSRSLQNFTKKLRAGQQEAQATFKAKKKRLEEEIKIIEEEISPLLQAVQKQVEVLTSHLAACKGLRHIARHKKPRGRRKTQERSQSEMLQVGQEPKMVHEKRVQWEEVEH
ncbi:PREDICTED: uncharacterized protein LOC107603332 [Ficedula albicollis]|uniref:uncharacterized protein LOC107603332 n=1 Tax=Ficedula albicollis TaxID=59894 RepID=UPI0007AD9606|nr:PREDICTED: uncharacterized protein LOC107603332 [Ficedula albicollis]